MKEITWIFAGFFALRLCSLAYSIRNERKLIAQGAKQYGKKNSLLLTLAHILYYASALTEGFMRDTSYTVTTWFGIAVLIFAYSVLGYVIYKLHDVWTLKLYIAPEHRIERSWLFRTIRHPNYYLNIIPELIGIALLCGAWCTLIFGLPLYAIILWRRIRVEEEVMANMW